MEIVWLFVAGLYLGFLVNVVYRDVVEIAKYRRNSRVEAIREAEDRLERYIRGVSDSNTKAWRRIRDLEDRLERVDILLDKVECVDRRLHLMDLRVTLDEINRESDDDEWKEMDDSD